MNEELKCSEYVPDDGNIPFLPCKCPRCGAFLKWNWEIIVCKKCGTELLVIPERDEETGKELSWGKICPISLRRKTK